MIGFSTFLRRKNTPPFSTKSWFPPIIVYAVISFFLCFADAIMSYIAPVEIERHVSSELLMGMIISFSSFVGFFCDMFFAQWFHGKTFVFFLFGVFATAFLFPLSFIAVPPWVPILLFAMAIWGIYFELMKFSDFHFIHAVVHKDEHAKAWGLLESILSLAYFIGPLVATFLVSLHEDAPHYGALGFFGVAMFGFLLFLQSYRLRHTPKEGDSSYAIPKKISTLQELRVWAVLWKKIWPLYMFIFTTILVDSTFWTVGTLISERLRETHVYGGLFLPMYTLPSLFMGLFAGTFARPFGKKRIAFISGSIAGALLALCFVVESAVALILVVFFSSLFAAVARPEIYATFEDYIARIGKSSNDLIGLQNSAGSVAYIVGPVVAGALASFVGDRQTIGVMGLGLMTVSLIALLIVPRKIQMPQKELERVESLH